MSTRPDFYLLPKTWFKLIRRIGANEMPAGNRGRALETLNAIGDAVISVDLDCRVLYLNAAAEKITGWDRGDALGRPIDEVFVLVDGPDREVIRNPLVQVLDDLETEPLTPNCFLRRRDGSEIAIEDSVAPILDAHGQVSGAVMVFHDVSVARSVALKLSYLAHHDALTDLPNRVLLKDRLHQAVAMAQRSGRKLALVYLDLDDFKRINDTLGHAVGDLVLQSVAQCLIASVRSADTVSRNGGDEFVILLPEIVGEQDAAAIGDKILAALRAPKRIGAHEFGIAASLGIAICPDDGTEVATLIHHADAAMYHAKNGGGDRYRFFAPGMNAHSVERQMLESGLRLGMERKEFLLHYQPQIDLGSGEIIGVEALVRWQHPQHGLMPASDFLRIAEDCGLIVPIGRWILREACRQLRAWQDAGLPLLRLAINVSALELRSSGFAADIDEILNSAGLDAGRVELELGEAFLIDDPEAAAAVLRALKDLGLRLALDDFGTGYSSLGYLTRFAIDTLKIDRSFVQDLASDRGHADVVSAVIGMGHSLHLRTIAEGVETREQLAFLTERCCGEGQGDYFSSAVPPQAIERLMRESSASSTLALASG